MHASEPLFVERWGKGRPVVFLHGLGASARYWDALRQATSGFRGIAPDLLGFGRSPAPEDNAYDVDAHLSGLNEHVPDESVIVAHSTGAVLAAAFARRHPGRVSRMLLLGLPAYPDRATARAEVGSLGMLARLTARGHPLARTLCHAMCRMRPLAIALAPLIVRGLPAAIAADAVRHTWTSYHRTLENVVLDHLAAPDLLAIRVPTVLLHGRADRTAPVAYVAQLAAQAHDSGAPVTLTILDGDHHLAVRRADRVGRLLDTVLVASGR